MMRAAFRAAMTGRPGPSYLAIPDDLLLEKIDADRLPPIHEAARYRVTDMGAGDPAAIERAADLLANAKRIYLHAGKGVLWADGCRRRSSRSASTSAPAWARASAPAA